MTAPTRAPFNVAYDAATKAKRVVPPLPGGVYMVIVDPASEEDRLQYDIYGWVRWWNWVLEDPVVEGAPVNPGTRFARRLWSVGQV